VFAASAFVIQCVAVCFVVCCSVLQRVLQCVAVCFVVCCSVFCSVLQCVVVRFAMCCSVFSESQRALQFSRLFVFAASLFAGTCECM